MERQGRVCRAKAVLRAPAHTPLQCPASVIRLPSEQENLPGALACSLACRKHLMHMICRGSMCGEQQI